LKKYPTNKCVIDMNDELKEIIKSEDLFTMDGYDDCIVGIGHRANGDRFVVYDTQKILHKLIREDGMTWHEAVEFHEFNQANAWVGCKTPAFVETFE